MKTIYLIFASGTPKQHSNLIWPFRYIKVWASPPTSYSFVKIYMKMTKLCSFNEENPKFSALRASCRTCCKRTLCCSLKPLQICTTSGAPCWKSKIILSRSIRRPMSWKPPCRPSGKVFHQNTSTRRWWTSPSAWLPTWAVAANCGHVEHLQ